MRVCLAELLIPDLNWRTASVLGVPIPPPLNIAIRPNKFEVGGRGLNVRVEGRAGIARVGWLAGAGAGRAGARVSKRVGGWAQVPLPCRPGLWCACMCSWLLL